MENGGDKVLGFLREARAALLEERDGGRSNREQSLTVTQVETAILWRQHDLATNREPVNEAAVDEIGKSVHVGRCHHLVQGARGFECGATEAEFDGGACAGRVDCSDVYAIKGGE